jgi:type 1 glutamine amidotransferase
LPPKDQLDAIRAHVAAGKPVVGIRTASHAFDPKKPDPGAAVWPTFDRDIFGGWYQNHYGKGPATIAIRTPQAKDHPLLTGLPAGDISFSSHLYKCREHVAGTTVLLNGRIEGNADVVEALAWVNESPKRKAFYTSLGSPEDFAQPALRRLLLNAVLWAVGQPIPPAEAELVSAQK